MDIGPSSNCLQGIRNLHKFYLFAQFDRSEAWAKAYSLGPVASGSDTFKRATIALVGV
jgi:hypothetical protein